jgi:hypothetical protein
MDYAHVAINATRYCAIGIDLHFSPEQVVFVEQRFLYNEPILQLYRGVYKVRHFLDVPGWQVRCSLLLKYNNGDDWRHDSKLARTQLENFRWHLLTLKRQPAGSNSRRLRGGEE